LAISCQEQHLRHTLATPRELSHCIAHCWDHVSTSTVEGHALDLGEGKSTIASQRLNNLLLTGAGKHTKRHMHSVRSNWEIVDQTGCKLHQSAPVTANRARAVDHNNNIACTTVCGHRHAGGSKCRLWREWFATLADLIGPFLVASIVSSGLACMPAIKAATISHIVLSTEALQAICGAMLTAGATSCVCHEGWAEVATTSPGWIRLADELGPCRVHDGASLGPLHCICTACRQRHDRWSSGISAAVHLDLTQSQVVRPRHLHNN